MDAFFTGFPDIHFKMDFIEELEGDKVMLDGLRAKGTHTKSYSCGPFPSIPATGKKRVAHDKETIVVHVGKNGKFTRLSFIARGKSTGPVGFYKQIGGSAF